MQYSHYQENIFEFWKNGKGNGLIDAVAGSGKTTVLVELAKQTPRSQQVLFLAFNKHIAEELKRRISTPNVSCATLHSTGLQMMTTAGRRYNISYTKYKDIITPLVENRYIGIDKEMRKKYVDCLLELTHFCQVSLIEPNDSENFTDMLFHFGIEIPVSMEKDAPYMVHNILKIGDQMASAGRIIDFNDMIWLPNKWDLAPNQVDALFVDEAQDLSPAGLGIAMRCVKSTGRSIFVGDPRQSIMGFAGADDQSFWKIKELTNATLLPLSVCYRCARSFIDLAQQIVPQIEARPDAPDGMIEYVDENELHRTIKPGDMVICRITAPLISLCIKLIEQRIPAHVKGRDIGKQITTIIDAVKKYDGYSWGEFGRYLDIHRDQTIMKLSQKKNADSMIESFSDKCNAVQVCYETFQCSSEDQLVLEISGLFSDDNGGITLATVHKTKGLEADRVFILSPEKMPLVWKNQQAWEAIQEMNIKYVALTRAKDYLGFIIDHAPSSMKSNDKGDDKNVLVQLDQAAPVALLPVNCNEIAPLQKRGRGRPLGSKNKKITLSEISIK